MHYYTYNCVYACISLCTCNMLKYLIVIIQFSLYSCITILFHAHLLTQYYRMLIHHVGF